MLIPVHIDSQGFPPSLPDAHSVVFPILAFPATSPTAIVQVRQASAPNGSSSQLATLEAFLHQFLNFTSIPIDLLIPPYSRQIKPSQSIPQQPRIGKIALHPELPVVALAPAHPGGSIIFFDLRTNAYLKYKLSLASNHEINCLRFSKYNLLAAGTSTGEVLLYQAKLSVTASTSPKPLQMPALPSFASLIPPQFPPSAILGEITGLDFDCTTARYLAVTTTRSGTWIYDTVTSSAVRLSKFPSSAAAFSSTGDILAVARERTGDIEFYTLIRAGTLTFSLPTIAASGYKSTVVNMEWASDGRTLLYSNDGQEGIRILRTESRPITPPGIAILYLTDK